MLKKVISVVLCLVLVLGVIAGCGNNEQGEGGKVTIKLMAPFGTQNSEIGRKTLEKIGEKFNVTIEVDAPSASTYTETVQLAMNDNRNRPDAILFNDTNDPLIRSAVEMGKFVNITEYVKAAENLQKHTLPSSWAAVDYKNDGSIYGVVRSTLIRADGLMIRQDWLDKLGITGVEDGKPITMEKFEEIMEKFSGSDLNANGQKVYGLAQFTTADKELVPLFKPSPNVDTLSGAFNLLGWQKAKDGEGYAYMDPKFSKVDPSFKEFLTFLQDAYKNKWIDPEWPSLTEAKAQENFKAGKYGVRWAFPAYVDEIGQRKVDPNARLTWVSGIANPNYENRAVGTTYSTGAWGGWYIMNQEKAELIVQILDYMLSDEMYPDWMLYGGEGVGFTLDENGERVGSELYYNTEPGVGGPGFNGSYMRRAKDVNAFFTIPKDKEVAQWNVKRREWTAIAVENLVLSLDNGYVPEVFNEQKFQDYRTKMNAAISDIVLGKADVSTYDDALAKWYDNMGKEYVEQMNAYIESQQNK